MALKVKTAPAVQPLSLADAKAHLRVTGSDDDADITAIIKAATAWVEQYTGRALITRTYQYGLRAFGGWISLPAPPLLSVDAITYVDTDGATQTLAANQYQVDTLSEFGLIEPAYNVTWPDTRDQANAVIVEYQAGYGGYAATIPGDIVAALKLVVGQLYEHREQNVVGVGSSVTEITFGISALLAPYRILRV